MIVFKNYFKIIKQHKFSILIYSIVFVLIMMFFSTGGTENTGYESTNVDIYLENNSKSIIAKGLEEYLRANADVKEIDPKHIEDELFYTIIQAIVIIPEDFETNKEVEYKSAPKSMYGELIKRQINDFLNKVNLYEEAGYEMEDAIENAKEDLETKVDVQLISSNSEEGSGAQYYFNFLHYVLMAQILLVVNMVATIYNKETIAKRNEVSPISKTSQNLQLTLGHTIVGILFWLIYIVVFLVFWPESSQTKSLYLLSINALALTFSIVALSYLLSKLILDENTLSAITNVVSLGTSFLSGAFVPQELLSDITIAISKLFPSYYYIKNNHLIVANPTLETMLPNMLIIIGFGIFFIILSIFIRPVRK